MQLDLAWFFDSHSHKNIRINHAPRAAAMARTMKRAGISELTIHAKAHDGFAYYPSKVGTPHPRMRGDAFGEATRACVAEGLRVLGYLSFGIDGEAARKHPEWCMVRSWGTDMTPDWFVSVCPFTGYLEELMLPQIAEVLADYPVSGLFFDTMGAMGVCYCEVCQSQFRAAHGLAIPRDDKDPNWGIYGQFRHARAFRMLERIGAYISGLRPGAKVGFNQIGTVRWPEALPAGLNCITLDYATMTPQSLQASACAAFGATADRPADVMSTIFNQGWGDWTPRPLPMLEQFVVPVWARNCLPVLGDRLHPANRLDPISVRAMGFVGKLRERVARQAPPAEARLTPDFLLLHGARQIHGNDRALFARDKSGMKPILGAHRLLLDAGANFAIVPEYHMEPHLRDGVVIIVPELVGIEAATAQRLRQFVAAGGQLLVVGAPPLVDGQPLDYLGVSRAAQPWQDHIYLPPWPGSRERQPVLVRGNFHCLTLTGALARLPAIRPYDCDHGVRFGWGIGPAESVPSAHPALTRHGLGRGAVWVLEAPLFSDYDSHGNWTQIAWCRELLAQLQPRPLASVASAGGSVEVVAHTTADSTWSFLLNHGGEQLTGERRWARTLAPVPAYPITVSLHDPAGRMARTITINGKPVKADRQPGRVTLRLRLKDLWRVVRVDWA